MLFHKTFSVAHVKQAPTSADLARINQFALEPVSEEGLFVGTMALCNDQVDRSHERFPEAYLKRFAETLPGKSVMPGHDYRQLPLGRFYDAEVTKRDGRTDLVASYYLLADDPLVGKIKAGIAKDVSIGFEPDKRICDLDGKDYDAWWTDDEDEDDAPCRHIVGREYDGKICTLTYGGDTKNVEAVEGSFVWMGCQPGAEAIAKDDQLGARKKAAWLANEHASVGSPITRKEKTLDKSTERAAPDKEQALDPTEKARLERLAAAGEKYTQVLMKRIETRWAAMQAEATGKSIASRLKEAAIDELEAAAAEADKLFEEKFAPPTASKSGDAAQGQEDEPLVAPGFNPLKRRVREML